MSSQAYLHDVTLLIGRQIIELRFLWLRDYGDKTEGTSPVENRATLTRKQQAGLLFSFRDPTRFAKLRPPVDKPRYREASQSRERPSVWILYTEPTLLTGADNNNRLTGDPSPWLVLLSSGTGTAAFLPNIKGERATSFPVVLFFARYLYLLPLCSRFLPVVGRSRCVVFVYGAEHGAVPDVPVFFLSANVFFFRA